MPGDGSPRARRRHAARRRHERRAPRRPCRGRERRPTRVARQQQERRRAACGARSVPRSSSTRSTSSIGSTSCTARMASSRALVRITPGVEAHTHEFIRTGQADSKFGFGVASGDAGQGDRASERVGVDRVRRSAPPHRQPGLRRRLLSPGGRCGRAVRARSRAGRAVDRRWPRRRVRRRRGGSDDHAVGAVGPRRQRGGRHRARITAEPGRAIVASAAVTLYTVGTVKELPDIRTYVSVDGG